MIYVFWRSYHKISIFFLKNLQKYPHSISKIDMFLFLSSLVYSLYIFYCHKLQQWGWVTSSRNISYDPPPTYTDQSKHVNMATNHIVNYTKT